MVKRKGWISAILLIIGLIGGIGYCEQAWLARTFTICRQQLGWSHFPIRTTEIELLSGNLTLRGTLYAPDSAWGSYPGIVICHGGTRFGRKLAMYVVMARELAVRGYVVLTFDFRGYGDSEDPHRFRAFSDVDFTRDVTSALTALASVKQVDATRLYVIGHSFGAGVGVAAGMRDVRVKKIVSIAPGRGTDSRFFGEHATDPDVPQIRASDEMKISPPIPKDILYPHMIDYVAEAVLDYPIHAPILLIDGADESEEDRAFLNDVYARMTAPKGYVTIRDADHYFGTQRDQNDFSENFPYDQSVMKEFIETIDAWIRQ